MRRFIILLIFSLCCFGGWYFWQQNPSALKEATNKLQTKELSTFKLRISHEKIMADNKKELLKNSDSTFLEPKIIYYPYLLMDVKYAKEGKKKTAEGMLLWGLVDGEMVIDTKDWKKTHGFEDCLVAKVKEEDFKLLKIVAQHGGQMEKEEILEKFTGDKDKLQSLIESCENLKLLVEEEGMVRLHFENPKLEIEPHTNLDEWIVTLNQKPAHKMKKKYSHLQITKFATLAFGSDFAIKRTQEVYLPVYEIAVQNSDGTILKSYWNALNGKRVSSYLQEVQ